jgi:hypothetical protein
VSFSLRIEPQGTYLWAILTGRIGQAELQSSFLAVLDACVQQGVSKVLVDLRQATGGMSLGERYQWAAFAAEAHRAHVTAGNPPLRLAVLGSEELVDPQRFGESVARNRGMENKVTTDPAEAAAWLEVNAADIT